MSSTDRSTRSVPQRVAENFTFTPLIYRPGGFETRKMPQEPMGYFGWLMNCCISDERSTSREVLSAALVFASGMATSVFTLYVAGLLHLI